MEQRNLRFASATNTERAGTLIGYPDECPRCHTKQHPKHIAGAACSTQVDRPIMEVFQCTNRVCERLFIAEYEISGMNPPRYRLRRLTPIELQKPAIAEIVTALSPTFTETFAQAMASESYGLTQLTGIGLRKALEFLVKDFAISKNSAEKDAILKTQLGACIEKYISDTSVKAMAKRATWLGNDETHYLRKWEDKDIEDLKILVRLTVNGIENVLLADKYEKEMPEKQKP